MHPNDVDIRPGSMPTPTLDGISEGGLQTQRPSLRDQLLRCRQSVKIVNIIPKAVRQVVAEELRTALLLVCAQNTEESWRKLLAFASVVLQMPPSKQHGVSWPTIIRRNIAAYKAGAGFEYSLGPRKPLRGTQSSDEVAAKRSSRKLAEGDVTGAVQALLSIDSFAPRCADSVRQMTDRHPAEPADIAYPACPSEARPSQTSSDMVDVGIRSFPNSSSAGPDGLRPRHLKDLTASELGESASRLREALARFVDLLSAGEVPGSIRSVIFGATLLALRKKDGTYRPIACSLTLRRLAAKIACKQNATKICSVLGPRQLGFGRPGGMEAAVHACRTYLTHDASNSVLVKLDFANAFNTLRRDHMIQTVADHVPELHHLVDSSYGRSSDLFHDDIIIESASGVQQGDPLGPPLFCLGTKELVDSLVSPLSLWYLDDGALGGGLEDVVADVVRVIEFEGKSGLRVNPNKCEVFADSLAGEERERAIRAIRTLLPGCRIVHRDTLELLGAPVFAEAVAPALEAKLLKVRDMVERRKLVGSYAALFVLRCSL